MKIIGFIDDSNIELEAFQSVFSRNEDYLIVTAEDPATLIEILNAAVKAAGQQQPDLLLFDLYFPDPSKPAGERIESKELKGITKHLKSAIKTLINTKQPNEQIAKASSVRKKAINVLASLLTHYSQGPDGGLEIFEGVQRVYPLVPKAFLSRKRTADDIPRCLARGAIDVLAKPDPDEQIENEATVDSFKRGWEENKTFFNSQFETLMQMDVIERHLTTLQVYLVTSDPDKMKRIQSTLVEAKKTWIEMNGSDKGQRIVKDQLLITKKLAKGMGENRFNRLLKILVGML